MDLNPRYSQFEIGRFTYGNPEVFFANSGARLRIGSFCSIAEEVQLFLGGEHRIDWVTTYPFPAMLESARLFTGHPATKGDIVIGHDVWIGRGATVLSGVKIGNGAVIGARALVAKDVPPYAIVSGNPAKLLRLRFEAEVVAALEAIRWWDWPLDRIEAALPTLLSADLPAFISSHAARLEPGPRTATDQQ